MIINLLKGKIKSSLDSLKLYETDKVTWKVLLFDQTYNALYDTEKYVFFHNTA